MIINSLNEYCRSLLSMIYAFIIEATLLSVNACNVINYHGIVIFLNRWSKFA